MNRPISRDGYQTIPDSDDFGGQGDYLLKENGALVSQKRNWFWKKLSLLSIPLIITTLYIFVLGKGESVSSGASSQLSNGTHVFKPTTILISIDGFRADYLDRGLTPNLKRIINAGSRAKFMVPSFPTVTFPNHYALATGLYPDSHGIVGNTFFDVKLNRTFSYRDHSSNIESEWWGGEPIWTSAVLQGQYSAVHMWPGSEVSHKNVMSSYLQPFEKEFELEDKAPQLLGWLDLPSLERPTFLGAYIPDVDTAGHDFGPNSNETRVAITKVDRALGVLLDGFNSRNLSHIVNVIVVSDHGMAEIVPERVIHLDDFIDMDLIASHHIFPYAGLTPKDEKDTDLIYQQLKNASLSTNFSVYKKDDIPENFHYGHNARVPPIFCIQESVCDIRLVA
ncbi:hypothetical protein DSO57_1002753 [Entomophthora muscae]|uniref:Uncharacterized protein n=1 Tax=Entomophthora muscae TaxID=34485 RepID=A0ACC2RNH1_9FUNG|nr:hypothetical protein DSO57_1002753 [Entomophthora muscae]